MGTALITGASAGLGEGFARALAAKGDDLILIARRADRLEALRAELTAKHGVAVEVIVGDLMTHEGLAAVVGPLYDRKQRIDTLINNAGFGAHGDFVWADLRDQLGMIDLNCRVLVELTHAILPGMVNRGSGGILNIASTAAFQPGPWMAVYYASKAFVLSFSEALHEEVRGTGVHVTALCPGPTRTEFADVAGMHDSALFQRLAGDADTVIRDGLAALKANRAVKVSGAANALGAGGVRFLPRVLARRLAGGLQKSRSK